MGLIWKDRDGLRSKSHIVGPQNLGECFHYRLVLGSGLNTLSYPVVGREERSTYQRCCSYRADRSCAVPAKDPHKSDGTRDHKARPGAPAEACTLPDKSRRSEEETKRKMSEKEDS